MAPDGDDARRRRAVLPPEDDRLPWDAVTRVRYGWANYWWYYGLALVLTVKPGSVRGELGVDVAAGDDEEANTIRFGLTMVGGPKEVAAAVARYADAPLERCKLGVL